MKSANWLSFLLFIAAAGLGCNKTNSPAGPANTPNSGASSGSASAPASPNNGASTPSSAGEESNVGGSSASAKATPQPVVIPAGKVLTVRLSQALSSKNSQTGQTFMGSLAEPVEVNGQPVIERGATVRGTVVNAKAMGHFKGGALLQLTLDSVTIKSQEHPVQTKLWSQALKGKGKRSAIAIGGGAGLGAALGGAFGGGKGAAIGAVAGGGAGTAGAAYTGNKEIELPSESAVRFSLKQALTLQ